MTSFYDSKDFPILQLRATTMINGHLVELEIPQLSGVLSITAQTETIDLPDTFVVTQAPTTTYYINVDGVALPDPKTGEVYRVVVDNLVKMQEETIEALVIESKEKTGD